MKKLLKIIFAVYCLSFSLCAYAQQNIGSGAAAVMASSPEASQASGSTCAPIIIYTATWCKPCQQMKNSQEFKDMQDNPCLDIVMCDVDEMNAGTADPACGSTANIPNGRVPAGSNTSNGSTNNQNGPTNIQNMLNNLSSSCKCPQCFCENGAATCKDAEGGAEGSKGECDSEGSCESDTCDKAYCFCQTDGTAACKTETGSSNTDNLTECSSDGCGDYAENNCGDDNSVCYCNGASSGCYMKGALANSGFPTDGPSCATDPSGTPVDCVKACSCPEGTTLADPCATDNGGCGKYVCESEADDDGCYGAATCTEECVQPADNPCDTDNGGCGKFVCESEKDVNGCYGEAECSEDCVQPADNPCDTNNGGCDEEFKCSSEKDDKGCYGEATCGECVDSTLKFCPDEDYGIFPACCKVCASGSGCCAEALICDGECGCPEGKACVNDSCEKCEKTSPCDDPNACDPNTKICKPKFLAGSNDQCFDGFECIACVTENPCSDPNKCDGSKEVCKSSFEEIEKDKCYESECLACDQTNPCEQEKGGCSGEQECVLNATSEVEGVTCYNGNTCKDPEPSEEPSIIAPDCEDDEHACIKGDDPSNYACCQQNENCDEKADGKMGCKPVEEPSVEPVNICDSKTPNSCNLHPSFNYDCCSSGYTCKQGGGYYYCDRTSEEPSVSPSIGSNEECRNGIIQKCESRYPPSATYPEGLCKVWSATENPPKGC